MKGNPIVLTDGGITRNHFPRPLISNGGADPLVARVPPDPLFANEISGVVAHELLRAA